MRLLVVSAATAMVTFACSSKEGAAPADAGAEGETRPDTFCFTRPVLQFCEDFDEGPLPARFETRSESGGALTVDTTTPASAPSSLLATVTASATEIGRARLEKAFGSGTKYRVFVQMREEQRSAKAAAAVRVLGLAFAAEPTYEVGVATNERGEWYGYERRRDEAGAETEGRFPASRALEGQGKWVSVRIDVDVNAAGAGIMTVRFGSDAVVDHVPIAPPFASAAPTMLLGLDAAGPPHDAWAFRYDNVTFQVD
ncbi:MAG: hypothetical protein KF819_00060 [Labilithrix sp.]|nr:hypothetical protein [Labilithrix sp.]